MDNTLQDAISNYDQTRAFRYDDESNFDKGNRDQHCLVLDYLLSFNEDRPSNFLELGCGTGFYTKIFIDRYPDMKSILVDGSPDMLNVTRGKFIGNKKIEFKTELVENLNWNDIPETDIVFSALTIHHLSNPSKYSAYKEIFNKLKNGGRFIYFDQFKVNGNAQNDLNEYLACKDMQVRMIEKFQLPKEMVLNELSISNIINNDRVIKAREGDKEDSVDETLNHLVKVGFKTVSIVYQEFRFFCLVAFK